MKTLNNFSKLTLMATTLWAGMASAATYSVMKMDVSGMRLDDSGAVETSFNFNQDPARAWVEITLQEDAQGDTGGSRQTLRKYVNGLKYDPIAKEVYIQEGSTRVVCGQVKRRGFPIKEDTVVENGNCNIVYQKKPQKVYVDDGFKSKFERQTVLSVIMNTK